MIRQSAIIPWFVCLGCAIGWVSLGRYDIASPFVAAMLVINAMEKDDD